jgi:rSAM/selenodomain-associated transferase 2
VEGRAARGVSVVMPVLNEAARIAAALQAVSGLAGIDEVIVVDGGSTDATGAIASSFPGVRLIPAPPGRGGQQNAGARVARGAVLLFLHADVTLPADAVVWIERALAHPNVVAGAFRIRTVAERTSWVARFLWLADLRSRWSRFPYGDQAIFVRREAFERVGGFPDQALMEDVELARRLWRIGRIVTVPQRVQVSGRRFTAAPVRAVLSMHLLPTLYRCGVSPERLARLYGNPR